jgi:hypothetical protein
MKKVESHELNLEGKLDMIRKGVRAVTRGFQVSRAIIGCLDEDTLLNIRVEDDLAKIIFKLQEKM